ncbi:MAG: hypothetical protein JW934_16065 [Anaerolineae bacterium]|nr:hypothetical protein [Anaerolineae bacterium]
MYTATRRWRDDVGILVEQTAAGDGRPTFVQPGGIGDRHNIGCAFGVAGANPPFNAPLWTFLYFLIAAMVGFWGRMLAGRIERQNGSEYKSN